MISMGQVPLLMLGAYLLGAVPFGYLVARLRGVDIRQHGSGNIGATNVGRVLGRKWGLMVFALDLGKGAAVMLTATAMGLRWRGGMTAPPAAMVDWVRFGAGFCCILGNTLPVYLRFKGGKGVATSLGVVLAIWPELTLPGVAAFVLWAVVVAVTRYVSLGSILAAVFTPPAFVAGLRLQGETLADHYPLLILCLLLAGIVLVRHRTNMRRLLAGEEAKIES